MDLTQTSPSRAASAQAPIPAPLFDDRPFLARLSPLDWLFALALVLGAGYAFVHYDAHMDYYDKAVLIGTVPALAVLGWRWKPARLLMATIAALSLLSIQIYQGDLARADSAFFLKYF
ncbi:c-type cytochrome biogenesis protein CcsB, partial [Paraburkholderia sp. Se-20369]|nr:c-type cytochrome biogenesis protein CcsB [Paraburkholderia sp. Se-20369]